MKTVNLLLLTMMSLLMISFSSHAAGELDQILEKKEERQSTKKSRRKKVQMCNECGKPEPQCECEGEEHRDGEKKKEAGKIKAK
jgi:hypothetical protein